MNINTIFANLEAQLHAHKDTYSNSDNIKNIYDKEIVDFFLNKITQEDINNYNYFTINIKNRQFITNLSGYINYISLYRFDENGDDKRNTDFFNYWKGILPINESPVYKMKTNEKLEVGIAYLLTDRSTIFINLIEKNKISLTPLEEKLFAEDILFNKTERISYGYLYNKEEFSNYLLNILKNNYHEIRNKKNEKIMLSSVFGSKEFLTILSLNKGGWEEVFSEDLCNDIYKKCSVKEISTNNPHLLSSLMYIAPPEKWIEGEGFFSFFKDIIKKATGYKTEELEKELNGTGLLNKNIVKSNVAAKEWLKRFKYLIPLINDNSLSDKEKKIWYLSIMKTKNNELFSESLKYINFPAYEKGLLHDNMLLNNISFEDKRTWDDLITIHNKELLEKKLEIEKPEIQTIKKFKV